MQENDENAVQLYTSMTEMPDGEVKILGYAYGEPWVAQALWMDDIIFDTPEKAKKWWEKNYGKESKA